MTTGNIKNIDIGLSLFKEVISRENFYVDKSRLIEHFLTSRNTVSLIARQRRLGKSLNMDMIRCFLTDKEDLRHLFKGLYIESSPTWEMAHSAPVFYFDFKDLRLSNYKKKIFGKIYECINNYCAAAELPWLVKDYLDVKDYDDSDGLLYLTEAVFRATGKRSYLLIDEYDKFLMDNYNTDAYDEVRSFITTLFSSSLKGNQYLEKALLTGVMRISHESMFSGLNNIVTYDVFEDETYTDDYGFTEEEISAINLYAEFDTTKLREWYNGVRISGKAIYNTYSVMSYLKKRNFSCFWGKSGTMDIITDLLNDSRRAVLAKLLNGEEVLVSIVNRVSLKDLSGSASDQAFYSLLVQAGYLAYCRPAEGLISAAYVSIPNVELMLVWKEFILANLYPDTHRLKTLFDNVDNLNVFGEDVEYFLSDRLSYHDLAVIKGENPKRLQERFYHIFLLGILSAYEDVSRKYPLSNRESGDGRYDILVEKSRGYFLFELKACDKEEDLEAHAEEALAQIDIKRYGADLDKSKRLIKVGVAFCGKQCRVKVS